MDLGGSLAQYQTGNEFTKARIIINHEPAGAFKTSHMDVPFGASIAGLPVPDGLSANLTARVVCHTAYQPSPWGSFRSNYRRRARVSERHWVRATRH